MKLTKRFTTYQVDRWDGSCPICQSKEADLLYESEGSWYKQYRCKDCKTKFAFNQGDAMGGQSDDIEIYENGK